MKQVMFTSIYILLILLAVLFLLLALVYIIEEQQHCALMNQVSGMSATMKGLTCVITSEPLELWDISTWEL